jgi:hypothetical protein
VKNLLFFLICISIISCEPKVQPDKIVNADSVIKADSVKRIQGILKNFLDTQTQFANAKPRFGISESKWPYLDISDSIHLLTIWFFPDGFLESVTDGYKKTGITFQKEYYKNGKLKSFYKSAAGITIDSSFYYSEKGTLDSAFDNNKKYKINYHIATAQAEKHWPGNDFYLELINNDGNFFWQATHCTDKDCTKHIYLRIDPATGKETFSKIVVYNPICS